MKVRIGKPRSWVSPHTVAGWICFWERNTFTDEDTLSDKLGDLLCKSKTLQKALDLYNQLPSNNVHVKIDHYDTWSADRTIAFIVVPLLKRIKDTKMGSPHVEDEDVPEHLRSTSAPPLTEQEKAVGSTDANWFMRWDWVLDEMIWAFEQHAKGDWDDQFYSGTPDIQFEPIEGSTNMKMVNGPNDTFKVDREGMEKHIERMKNGRRLFAKYFEALWD